MAKVADEILINIKVNKAGADREVRQWQGQYNKSMDSIGAKTDQIEQKIKRSSSAIGGHLRTLAGALAAGVSVGAVTQLLDKYTQLENRLKVTGLAGRDLAAVQDRLFESANKNGTAINGLGELYSRMALSQKELGASTEQLLQVTAGVSSALRVQGLSAEQAAGPLLQMSQALGAGVVRAEEFNSMIEGMPVLVQAVAKHIDGAGGSISGLRKLMIDGKVTSQEFFQALLKGLPEIEAQAAKSSLTIGQAMTTLNNELIRYAGQVDASLGVSAKFVEMINLLSANLDKIAPAIGVIAAVIGGRFLAGLVGSTAATISQAAAFERAGGAALVAAARYDRMTVSTSRMMTATDLAAASAGLAAGQMSRMGLAAATAGNVMSGAGSKILSVFGGPVGLAVTGLTLAISGLAMEAYQTAADIESLNTSVEAADDLIAKFQPKADTAGGAVKDIGNEATIAAPKITAFAGEVGKAAQELWNLAKAKQAAALAELNTQRQQLSQNVSNVQQNLPENITGRLNNRNVTSLSQVFEPIGARIVQIAKDAWTGGEATTRNRTKVAEGLAGLARLDAEIARVDRDLESFAKVDTTPSGGGGAGSTPKKKGSGRSEAAEARRLANEAERDRREQLGRQRAMEDDLYRLGDAMLQTLMDRELTAQEQLDLELEALKRDRDANNRSIDREVMDKEKTETEGQTLKELEEALYQERVANANRKGQKAIKDEQLRAEQAILDLQLEMLQIAAGNARSQRESRELQLRLLEAQQKRTRDELESRIASDPALQARAPELRGDLEKLEKAQTDNVIRNTMEPLQAWFDQSMMTADQVREAYQQVAVDGLNSLTDGLVDIVTGTKTAKEAFADMAKSILADLTRIAIKQAVVGLAKNFFPGFSEGGEVPSYAGGGLIRGPGTGTSDSIRANVSAGEYIIKEKQTRKYKDLLDAINNDKVPGFSRGGMVGSLGGAGSVPSSMMAPPVQNFYIDAKGSILAQELMDGMQQIGAKQAGQAGIASVAYTQSKQQRAGIRNRQRFV